MTGSRYGARDAGLEKRIAKRGSVSTIGASLVTLGKKAPQVTCESDTVDTGWPLMSSTSAPDVRPAHTPERGTTVMVVMAVVVSPRRRRKGSVSVVAEWVKSSSRPEFALCGFEG